MAMNQDDVEILIDIYQGGKIIHNGNYNRSTNQFHNYSYLYYQINLENYHLNEIRNHQEIYYSKIINFLSIIESGNINPENIIDYYDELIDFQKNLSFTNEGLDLLKTMNHEHFLKCFKEEKQLWIDFSEVLSHDLSVYQKNLDFLETVIDKFNKFALKERFEKFEKSIEKIDKYVSLLISICHYNYPFDENFSRICQDALDSIKIEILDDNSPFIMNKDNSFYSLSGYEELSLLMKSINNNFLNIREIKASMNNTEYTKSSYIQKNSSNEDSTSKFISQKLITEWTKTKIDINNEKYESLIIFDDESIAFKKTDGTYLVPFTNFESRDIIKDVVEQEIEFKLKKKPTLSKQFKKVSAHKINSSLKIFSTINTFLENENILKNSDLSIISELEKIHSYSPYNFDYFESSSSNTFEILDDKMNSIVREHKIKQYAHSIASNKYMHLYNQDIYETIKEIYDMNISASTLQLYIGKKIASFKTSDDFNSALMGYLDTINSFNPESIKLKALNNNVLISVEDDNLIILKIDNFNQSKVLGSPSWCISREAHYFNSYKERSEQYFIYDFSKNSKDPLSMIGITLNNDGEVTAAHEKDDNNIMNKKVIIDKYKNLINKEKDNFTVDFSISNKIRP